MKRESAALPGRRSREASPLLESPRMRSCPSSASWRSSPPASAERRRLRWWLHGWGEARVGEPALDAGWPERDPFYEHVIAAARVGFEVRDAGRDKRPAPAGAPRAASSVRGYAACALRADTGEVLGTARGLRRQAAVLLRAAARDASRRSRASARLCCASRAHCRARDIESGARGADRVCRHARSSPTRCLDSAPVAIYYADTSSGLTERQSRIPSHVRALAAAELRRLGSRRASGGSSAGRDPLGRFLPQSAAHDFRIPRAAWRRTRALLCRACRPHGVAYGIRRHHQRSH